MNTVNLNSNSKGAATPGELEFFIYTEETMDINTNYFCIQSWMVSKLKLKGAERDVFAIIYGFSQNNQGEFHGSLQYLTDLTGYSKNAICTALGSLTDKKLLIKEERNSGCFKFCSYKCNLTTVQDTCISIQETCMETVQDTCTNNKVNNKDNNNIYNVGQTPTTQPKISVECIRETISNKKEQKNNYSEQIKEVIDYLNKVLGTKYNSTSKTTVSDLSYIFKNGYTIEQCKQVIERKKEEWIGTEMEQYLRPSTLFRFSKFENYVNQIGKKCFRNTKNSIYNKHPDSQTASYGLRKKNTEEELLVEDTVF